MVAHSFVSELRHLSIQACSERPESQQESWYAALAQHLANRVASLLVIIRRGACTAVESLVIDIHQTAATIRCSVVCQGARSFMAPTSLLR